MAEKSGPTPMGSQNNLQAHQHGSKYGSKWIFGFWDCCSPCSTCCLGFWCPCFLFGKTYAREHGEGETSGCSWMVSNFFSMKMVVRTHVFSVALGIVPHKSVLTHVCNASSDHSRGRDTVSRVVRSETSVVPCAVLAALLVSISHVHFYLLLIVVQSRKRRKAS